MSMQRKVLKINEFVPSLKTLKELMEATEPPPSPTEEELQELNELEELNKVQTKDYLETCKANPTASPMDPIIDTKYRTLFQTQSKLLNIRNIVNHKIELIKFYRCIGILRKNNLEPLLKTFFNLLNNGLPSITFFLLKYDDICRNIQNPDDYLFFRKFDIIPMIVEKKPVELTFPIFIPRYNLLHMGNICHFNSCINVLSSLTGLINELSGLKTHEKLNEVTDALLQYILNSHSFVDLNPGLLIKILDALHVSLTNMDEANESMKKIMRQFYAVGVSLNTVFYWDSTDEFYKKKELTHQLSTKLSELKPMYFLCNNHDFNSIYNIDSHMIELQSFDVTDEHNKPLVSYALSSFIIFNSNHYTSAFVRESDRPLRVRPVVEHEPLKPANDNPANISESTTDNESTNESTDNEQPAEPEKEYTQHEYDIEIKNDICSRYETSVKPIDYAFFRGNQHVLSCYVRADL